MYLESQQKIAISKGITSIFSSGRRLPRQFARIADTFFSLLRKEVWRLESGSDSTQRANPVLFIGNHPEKHFIGRLFFKKGFTCRSLGHFWLWQILIPKRAWRHTHSFCVIQTRWMITKCWLFKKWHCLPTWIYGSVDLMADFRKHTLKSNTAKSTLRKIRKSDFNVQISSDPSLFDEFYYQFHQPYMENRHGKSAVEESYLRMKSRFLKGGELLFVSSGSQRVAGCMLRFHGDGVTAYRLGVRDGDFKWVEKGAISALYFHMLNYYRLRGFRKLNLGGSRPFFSDGVLNYKLKNWNMKIDSFSEHSYFLLKPLSMSPFTEAFLCSNPFISLKKNHMVANSYFKDADRFPGAHEKDNLKSRFTAMGPLQVALYCCFKNSRNQVFNKHVHEPH